MRCWSKPRNLPKHEVWSISGPRSHGRCLALSEWAALLEDAGFAVEHSEHMDQDIEFDPWVQRMRCAGSTIARLKAMLGEEPLASLLKPRETFTLQEAIIIARKPS